MNEDKKVSKQKSYDDVLELVEGFFSASVSFDTTWRDRATAWYQYYFGDQWTSEEIAQLNDRGQAVSTYNHIKPAIDSIIGGERQNRPDIKMVGRTPDDEQISQAKTSMYDYISYNTRSDDHLDKMIRDALVTGRGWMYVYPNMVGNDFDDLMHEWIDYRDMFVDGLSKKDDMSDARYVHQAVFTDEDIVKQNFPKYKSLGSTARNIAGYEGSSEDNMWYDEGNRSRPRLITTWYKDEKGELYVAVWTRGQLLYKEKSPYRLNRFPYIQLTIERDLENYPIGYVKTMISPQDEVNKRHSKALHYLNSKQVWAEENAFKDELDAKKTLARPDGITIFQDDALKEGRAIVLDNIQLANTHIQLMEHAKGEILALAGINGGYVGQSSNYDSAKKTQINIAQAQNVLVPFLNRVRIARYDLAYITMAMASDFYSDERLVRILEPDGKYSFMPINQIQMMDDNTLKKVNDLTVDDIDIIIEDAPRGLNEKQEQLNMLLGIQGQTSRPIPMEILLRYTDLKDKYQLSEELKAHYSMESQMQQVQQYAQQLEQQVQQLGGQIQQQQSQIIQTQTAREVEREVGKAKEKLQKELNV